MLKGLGTDIVEIPRIERLIQRYGLQFLGKVFSEAEIVLCGARAQPAIHYSGRWAAKEAFYKALPADLQHLAHWKCIEVLAEKELRRPEITVTDERLKGAMLGMGMSQVLLSISHERSYCVAVVTIE